MTVEQSLDFEIFHKLNFKVFRSYLGGAVARRPSPLGNIPSFHRLSPYVRSTWGTYCDPFLSYPGISYISLLFL